MVTFLFISNVITVLGTSFLLIVHIQLKKCLKELEDREIKLAEVVHETLKEDNTEEDTAEEEPKEISPYEYADMILRGKVDIENELRE